LDGRERNGADGVQEGFALRVGGTEHDADQVQALLTHPLGTIVEVDVHGPTIPLTWPVDNHGRERHHTRAMSPKSSYGGYVVRLTPLTPGVSHPVYYSDNGPGSTSREDSAARFPTEDEAKVALERMNGYWRSHAQIVRVGE